MYFIINGIYFQKIRTYCEKFFPSYVEYDEMYAILLSIYE